MTITEMEIVLKLRELVKQGKRIELKLYPGIGNTTIDSRFPAEPVNRLFINEGRDGKWEGVSEQTYDQLVSIYDSRCNNRG
jgi:hypothetical protein